jgi:hypothetical protein
MFGSWLRGIGKDLKLLFLLGVAAKCWLIWLRKNDIIFAKRYNFFPLQVILLIMQELHTLVILQKLASQDFVIAAS